jgi:ketosteroid isomerase-like protein
MMHRTIPFALLVPFAFVACAQPSRPPVDLAAEQQAVIAASDSCVAAEMSRNIDGALAWWADDAIFHMEGAPEIVGKAGLRGVYETMFGDTTMLGFSGERSSLVVASGGDMAWERGVNRFQVRGPDDPIERLGKYLLVWRKSPDGWRIAALAVTNDAPMSTS